MLFQATLAVLFLGVAVALGVILWAGDLPRSAEGAVDWAGLPAALAVFAVAAGLGVAPYGLIALVARASRASIGLQALALVVALGLVALAVREYHNAFVVNLDPQSALILLFVPVLQIAIAGLLIAVWAGRRLWQRWRG